VLELDSAATLMPALRFISFFSSSALSLAISFFSISFVHPKSPSPGNPIGGVEATLEPNVPNFERQTHARQNLSTTPAPL
jgi:hypothetical protein